MKGKNIQRMGGWVDKNKGENQIKELENVIKGWES